MNFPNHYKRLRKNASLASVAEAAARQSRNAQKQWKVAHQSITDAMARKEYIRPEAVAFRETAGRYLDECRELAKHLNRLAGTDWPTSLKPTGETK